MPTVQGTDDFNHAIDTSFYDVVFGAPTSELSPLYAAQPRSLKVISAGSNIGVRKNLTGSPTRAWAAFPLRYTGANPAADVSVLSFSTANGVSARLYINTNGDLYGFISGTSGAATALSPDIWYWVEAIFDVSGGTHELFFRVEGVDGTTVTRVSTASTVDYNQLLSFTGDGSLTWYAGMWKRGTAASDTDWLGEPTPPPAVTADFRLPYEIGGPAITDTLGELPLSTLVQRVYAGIARPPTATDDVGAGHGPGDVWIYAGTGWWCVSAAAGAAVWKKVTT